MNALKEKLNSGSITMVNLVTWGISIALFATSITYASYSTVKTDIVDLRISDAKKDERLKNIERDVALLVDELIKK